ncbi:hypothetical protein TURU_005005 [Turdus rufiventris]|nr:hypothetical protein TURU_005005 [Turdus rufiventris]
MAAQTPLIGTDPDSWLSYGDKHYISIGFAGFAWGESSPMTGSGMSMAFTTHIQKAPVQKELKPLEEGLEPRGKHCLLPAAMGAEMSFKEKSADLLLMSTYTEINTQYRIHLYFEYCRRRTRKAVIENSRLTFRKFLTPSQISCVIFTKSFNLSLIQLRNHEDSEATQLGGQRKEVFINKMCPILILILAICPRGPACPWVPKHPVEVLAETRFLYMSHTYAEEKYIISMRWGPPDLRMLQEQRNDEAWSTCTVPATGQEPLSSRLLTMFARDCINPGSRSDPTA